MIATAATVRERVRARASTLDQQIADYCRAIIGPGRPRRFSKMTRSGDAKYFDLPKDEPFTDAMLRRHAAGVVTYAATLDRTNEAGDVEAQAGVIEIDQGGREAVERTIQAAARRGVTASGFVMEGKEHTGGHVWCLFDRPYPVADVAALMVAICADAGLPDKTEIWPRDKAHDIGSDQGIRAPFGFHQRNQTRGALLLPSGEYFPELDDQAQRAEALAALQALPMNGAPPVSNPVQSRIEKAAQVSDKKHSANPVATNCNTKKTLDLTRRQGGRIDTRAITAATIARYNEEHPIGDLMLSYGGHQTRDGWACNCGYKHANKTQIAITSQGKIVSFSPNCRWAPHKDSEQAHDAFNLYILVEHSGNRRAAIETMARQYGYWQEPQNRNNRYRSDTDPIPPEPPEQRYSDAERAAYNAERKARRHADTRAALASVYDQVNALDLVFAVPAGVERAGHDERARRLFGYLHQLADERGVLQVAPTNAQIAEALDMCERYVIYAFRELEAAGLGKRTGGRGGLDRPNEAAVWTFYRSPNLGCKPQQDAECTLGILESDLVTNLEASERAPAPEPASEPDYSDAGALDLWQWCDDAHGAEDLAGVLWDDEPQVQPEPDPPEAEPLPVLLPTETPYQRAARLQRQRWLASLDAAGVTPEQACGLEKCDTNATLAASAEADTPQQDALIETEVLHAPVSQSPSAPRLLATLYRRLGRDDDADRWLAEANEDPENCRFSPMGETDEPHQNAVQVQPAESEPESAPGASYVAELDQTQGNAAPYSEPRGMLSPKDSYTFGRRPADEVLPLRADAGDAPEQPQPVNLLWGDPEAEGLVRCPPAAGDRQYVTFCKHWYAARQPSRSPKQRAYFQRQADALLTEAEPDEAARRWAPFKAPKVETARAATARQGGRARLTSSPAAGRPVDQQPALFALSEVSAYGSHRPTNAAGTMGIPSLASIRSP